MGRPDQEAFSVMQRKDEGKLDPWWQWWCWYLGRPDSSEGSKDKTCWQIRGDVERQKGFKVESQFLGLNRRDITESTHRNQARWMYGRIIKLNCNELLGFPLSHGLLIWVENYFTYHSKYKNWCVYFFIEYWLYFSFFHLSLSFELYGIWNSLFKQHFICFSCSSWLSAFDSGSWN